MPSQEICFNDWEHYRHLIGLPIADIKDQPKILIGQDNINLIVARKIAQGPENVPIATKTSIGWILHGRAAADMHKNNRLLQICENDESEDFLH